MFIKKDIGCFIRSKSRSNKKLICKKETFQKRGVLFLFNLTECNAATKIQKQESKGRSSLSKSIKQIEDKITLSGR